MLRRVSGCLLAVFCVCGVLAGCAKPPKQLETSSVPTAASAYISEQTPLRLSAQAGHSSITGRTLRVSRIEDIKLRDHEVVLTFDDGPHPSRTSKILDALDKYRVKAVFLSVGRMAETYPEVLRDVAKRGHTIGTHTHDHANLKTRSEEAALAEIGWGYRSVAKALAPAGKKPAQFFRFPYLADTRVLRADLAGQNMVILDVDIDSKDYIKKSPQQVVDGTMAKLRKRGRGIILFHDIQARTASAMPNFLEALAAEGYEVVNLVPAGRGLFEKSLVTAGLD